MLKDSELKFKDVVDIKRGKKLGFIDDIDFEEESGKIKAFIIPGYKNKLLNIFSSKKNIVLKWKDIIKIGEDVILVEKEEASLKS